MNRACLLACLTGCVLAVLAGCDRGNGGKTSAPEVIVPVAQPAQRMVTDYVDYTGRTNAKNSVVIQPRVTGYLVKEDEKDNDSVAFFKEGAFVKKDQVLFKVDPSPYKAQLEAAQASVAQNKAGLEYAKETNELYKEIAKNQPTAVGPRELAQYRAQEKQAKANLDLAEANLKAAELNLKWTEVKSPINGQVSRVYLTPGNLVNQDVTQLTTVVSLDPMYVYFDMDEPTQLRITKAINEGTIVPRSPKEAPAAIGASTFGLLGTPLSRGPIGASSLLYPGRLGPDAPVLMALTGEGFDPNDKNRQGFINFMDNQYNPGTGSIPVRAEFRNPKPEGGTYLLKPGMFVRVRLPIGQPQQELLVKDSVITSEQGLKYVYVLDEDGKVKSQPVSVGALQEDSLRVITSGLKKDDWVVVGGLQQVRPGMTVKRQVLKNMPSLRDPPALADEPKANGKTKK
jgi:multidrug efflux system membrane fusion protein